MLFMKGTAWVGSTHSDEMEDNFFKILIEGFFFKQNKVFSTIAWFKRNLVNVAKLRRPCELPGEACRTDQFLK
jgi:hypothetical protein